MKKVIVLFIFLSSINFCQTVKGIILSTENNTTVVKVWGNHYERGYAHGFLLANKIDNIYRNYIKAKFGTALPTARSFITDSMQFKIDSLYILEAKGVEAGMVAAGFTDYDYVDLLVANSLLDLSSYMTPLANINFNFGCSSLMSWGDATLNTALNGKSVISRHLDWEVSPFLFNNQVIVVHIPSETNEQPWLMIGFAGQIAVLSGTNQSGVSAFQHVLSGITGHAGTNKQYEPIWFAIRKGIERKDYNNDGRKNTNDVRDALLSNVNGFATCCIVSISAPSTEVQDSLIALVAEVTHTAPYHTFRSNSYDDLIPSDNLYAANSPIKRNDAKQYCSRYLSVVNYVGNGLNIDSVTNWTLLRDYSRVANSNLQLMQVIPELKKLKLSVYKNGAYAYNNNPYFYNLDSLFSNPVNVKEELESVNDFVIYQNYPNPFNPSTIIKFWNNKKQFVTIKIFNILGNEILSLVNEEQEKGFHSVNLNGQSLSSGVYYYKVTAGNNSQTKKMILIK